MRVERCAERTVVAFGQVTWGSAVPPFPVEAGSVIKAERIEPLPEGHRVTWFVSSPLYVEGPGDRRVMHYIHEDRMETKSDLNADVWDAWLGGYAAADTGT